MKEAVRRRTLFCVGLGGLLALLFACGPAGDAGGMSASGNARLPGSQAGAPAFSAAAPASSPAPARVRPVLLEPIVEARPAGADRSLEDEDLRDLGELGLLPHVVQSISSGAPCDFNDAMSHCQ